jgi:hypothetical protein
MSNKAAKSVAPVSTFDRSKFKIVRQVTLPLWKWNDDETKYFRIDGEIRIGKPVKATEGQKQMEPAHIASVTNLETNVACEVIVGAVLHSELAENYPNNGYVGKSFAATKTKITGKRYAGYSISEIAL